MNDDDSAGAPPVHASGDSIGDYRLVRFVAAGGMGQVWEAEESSLGRTVALKLLHPGPNGLEPLDRFAREARAGARVRHPNLVSTLAYGEHDGIAWIAQEFVPGARTLANLLHARRRRSHTSAVYFRWVAKTVASLADGLHVAHEAGVVHRDVKPANILLDHNGAPRLSDFGLARLIDETALTRPGAVAGTWAYMSPEQVRGRGDNVDRRSDVFSLGVVLYELLTLRRPFDGDSAQRTAEQILVRDPRDPRALRSGCPADLATIALHALQKAPDQRYATAAELASDIRRHLAHEPIVASPPNARQRARRWIQRHPAPTAIAITGALGLCVIGAMLQRTLEDARHFAAIAEDRAALARRADADRDQVLRLASAADLELLMERQSELWPPLPERSAELAEWVAAVTTLVEGLDGHRTRLAQLRAQGDPSLGADEARWLTERLAELVELLDRLEGGLLSPEARSPEFGWSVPLRLDLARRIATDHRTGGAAALAWDSARSAIRDAYDGLDLAPIVGLVPLGPDPSSGLWEFAHLASGEPPTRDPEGRLVLTAESAVTLVLIPAGSHWIGAQREDPDGRNFAPALRPVYNAVDLHRVECEPFLMSKYELTQGQWLRLTGANPSTYRDEPDFNALHPVESVSAAEVQEVLERFDLAIPDSSSWEIACRAGTETPFHQGSDTEAATLVNAWDRTTDISDPTQYADAPEGEYDDGAVFHAKVGSYPANAYGLHDVHGNVWEFSVEADPNTSEPRFYKRGGSFLDLLDGARSYVRIATSATSPLSRDGVRPFRRL